ncbi:chemotaxis protein CheA [Sphingomonas sp. DBB INV C78]|uniref:chemotaxis protein CheA n=1 Tax=Sphingomonas sp. DBB INV C78 TaxID=3349434 RepID=UPI0036D37CF5
MDELLAQFLIEGRDLVAQASADLADLAHNPGARPVIDSAFRAIHTLKGSVGIFPMGPAERVLHAAEDVLEQARKGTLPLDEDAVFGLVTCVDLVDRWIDELEQSGTVGPEADRAAAMAIAALLGTDGEFTETTTNGAATWLDALVDRSAEPLLEASSRLVAFHYAPHADCFFRGDDPLAIAAAVPGLVSLQILPRDGAWPGLDGIEPFICVSILEGLSAAPLDEVRAAFRLVSDQVQFELVEPHAHVGEAGNPNAGAATVLRVDVGRIDALADGLGELVVSANALASLAEDAARMDGALASRIRAAQARIEGQIANLHRSIGQVRLVPLAPTLRRLPRMVREIAESLDKRVVFAMTGDAIEVDKQIADGVFEPLLHLVRNAIDHGIEDSDGRRAAAKSAEGKVSLGVQRDGNGILLTLSDDGAGLDPSRLREVAIARGVLTLDAAAQLDDRAALRLIFAAGFSTATEITPISGRGIGMHAVETAVEKLRGSIEIESTSGVGTHFRLRLPATSLTTRLLVVAVGEHRYGVALDQIVETVRVANDALIPVGEGLACILRGKTVPVLSLAKLLGDDQQPGPNAKLLVTRSGGDRVALRVDGFADRIDTIVRPPSGLLATIPMVSGSALLGDGSVLLVLDLPELTA